MINPINTVSLFYLFIFMSLHVFIYFQQSGNLEKEKYENGLVAYVFNVNTRNHVTVKTYGSYEVVSTWQQKSEQQRLINMMQSESSSKKV